MWGALSWNVEGCASSCTFWRRCCSFQLQMRRTSESLRRLELGWMSSEIRVFLSGPSSDLKPALIIWRSLSSSGFTQFPLKQGGVSNERHAGRLRAKEWFCLARSLHLWTWEVDVSEMLSKYEILMSVWGFLPLTSHVCYFYFNFTGKRTNVQWLWSKSRFLSSVQTQEERGVIYIRCDQLHPCPSNLLMSAVSELQPGPPWRSRRSSEFWVWTVRPQNFHF